MRSKAIKHSFHNVGRNFDWDPSERGATYQHDVLHESQHSDDIIVESGSNGLNWSRGSSLSDVGGDLFIVRRIYEQSNTPTLTFEGDPTGPPDWLYQRTPQLAKTTQIDNGIFPWGWYPPTPPWSVMDAKGAEGISKTIPTAPVYNLAAALGELAGDGLPKAMLVADTAQRRTRRCVNAGDEYLNVEFGWKPLVRDVKAFAQAVVDREKILSSYHKLSGSKLRRTYRWRDETDEGEWTEGNVAPSPALYGRLYRPDCSFWLTAKATGRVEWWFTATYQYFVPKEKTPERWLSDAHHLLGVKLTPEVLWQLAPWSWAADWVSNTGDIMKNASALTNDSVVIRNAYIMRKHTVTYEYTNQVNNGYHSHPGPMRLTQKFTTVIKSRRRANPYGFGVSWDGLSPTQWAILAALSISRY